MAFGILLLQQFVEVERVHPFRVEAGKHLIHHDQQIKPFLGFGFDAYVGRFVGETRSEVFFEIAVTVEVELLPVGCVVIF